MNIDEIAEEIVYSFSEEKYLDEKYTGSNRDTLLQKTRGYKKQAIKIRSGSCNTQSARR